MTAGQASEWTARLGRARKVIAAALPATPLIPAHGLGKGVLLKLESFQSTGSFKVRGALAALSAAKNGNGVLTASTGNYALGGAWAAHRLGVPATLAVPATAAAAKLAALQRYPATVIVHGDHYEDAEQHARSLATSSGLRYLSASSDPEVIAGQASIGFELLTQLQGSFTVVCGVGGGGLALGLGLAANRSGRMSISGVEAAASPAMSTAIRAGHVVPIQVGPPPDLDWAVDRDDRSLARRHDPQPDPAGRPGPAPTQRGCRLGRCSRRLRRRYWPSSPASSPPSLPAHPPPGSDGSAR